VADLPIDLGGTLADRLAQCLDAEAKIPRALEALGPLGDRDVVLLEGGTGLRARQLASLGARLTIVEPPDRLEVVRSGLGDLLTEEDHQLVAGDACDLPGAENSADAVVSLWSAFRGASEEAVAEADRVLRPEGRLLVLHDYGRDDVSRLRGAELPEYGAWSRRDGWFLRNGFKLRVIHCWWTWPNVEAARSFLGDAFGRIGAELGDSLRRPRLSYNVAIYHRSRGAGAGDRSLAAAGRA
jgi:SAM-dependent methyltransferase